MAEILTSIHGRRFGIGPNGELVLNGREVTGPTTDLLWAGAPLERIEVVLRHFLPYAFNSQRRRGRGGGARVQSLSFQDPEALVVEKD